MGCAQSKESEESEESEAEARALSVYRRSATLESTEEEEEEEKSKHGEVKEVSAFGLWSDPRQERAPWSTLLEKALRTRHDPRDRPASTVGKLLRGEALGDRDIHALGTRQPAIRLFLSSTFTDTELERNVLIEDVYPFLKALGQRFRVQVYQSSEMRWGIRAEASASHQTSEICMKEISRCQDESSGLNYVLILGNKYGFRPFPAKIPEDEFARLKAEITRIAGKGQDAGPADTGDAGLQKACAAALTYLDTWFQLDENAVPAVRLLKPVSKEDSDAWWSEVFPTLQCTLRKAAEAASLSGDRQALYWQSVTAEEIQRGLLNVEPQETRDKGCFVFDRNLDLIDATNDPKMAKLWVDMKGNAVDNEAQQLLEKLRTETLPAALSADRIKAAHIPWGPGIDLARRDHAEYMRDFADTFCEVVASDIERVAREHAFDVDPVVEEAAAQELFGNLRRQGFVTTAATEETSKAALDHVVQRVGRDSGAAAAPLAICGVSGSGKTSLMAHIAGLIKRELPEAVVISRFLGTSRDSGSARRLMASVYRHIHRAVQGKAPEEEPAANFEALTAQFKSALKLATADCPLVLVLDSLDQLSDEDQGRKLEWLPLDSLPPHCTILVSSLPDVGGCWQVLKGALPESHQRHVARISSDDADRILTTWLANAGRTLTAGQRAAVLVAYEACPTPLFLRVCVDYFALGWRHSDQIPSDFFPQTVEGLLEKVFDELETRHGRETVAAALGYLSASRGGLTDNEMEDLLSCNDTVLDEVYEWWEPPVRRVPPLIWARIVSDLKGALVERGAEGGVTVRAWYHRQHREAAERRYLGPRATSADGTAAETVCTPGSLALQRHSELADYFMGRWEHGRRLHARAEGAVHDRKVASMKTVLSGRLDDPRSALLVNVRKVTVLPYHLLNAQRWDECAQTLCDLEFIEAKAYAGMVRDLCGNLKQLQAHAPQSLVEDMGVDVWLRFATANAHIFEHTPDAVVARALLFPDWTPVFQAADALLSSHATLRPRVLQHNKPQDLERRVAVFPGPPDYERRLMFTRDGAWLCSGGDTGELRVWEATSGTPVTKITMPHNDAKICRMLQLPNGHVVTACAIGAFSDGPTPLWVWSLNTRELVHSLDVLDGDELFFRQLAMAESDKLVLALCDAEASADDAISVGELVEDDSDDNESDAESACSSTSSDAGNSGEKHGGCAPDEHDAISVCSSSSNHSSSSSSSSSPRDASDSNGSLHSDVSSDSEMENPSRVLLIDSSLTACLWQADAEETLVRAELRDNTLVATTEGGSVVWYQLEGIPQTAPASSHPVQGQLLERARFTPKKRGDLWRIRRACLLPNSHSVVAVSGQNLFKVRADGSILDQVELATKAVGLSLLKQGTLAAVSLVTEVLVFYDVETLDHVWTMSPVEVGEQAISPDGMLLATAGFTHVTVLSLAQVGAKQGVSQGSHPGAPTSALAPCIAHLSGKQQAVYSVAGDWPRIQLHDARTLECVKTVDVSSFTNGVHHLEMSPDGRFLLCTATDSSDLFVVDVSTCTVHEDVFEHSDDWRHGATRAFFSPTSDLAISSNAHGSMCVLSLPDCKVVLGYAEGAQGADHHTAEVQSVAWHPRYPSVREFVTASTDGSVRLWRMTGSQRCEPVRRLSHGARAVTAVILCALDNTNSPRASGTSGSDEDVALITADTMARVRVWRLDADEPHALWAAEDVNPKYTHNISIAWLSEQQVLVTCCTNRSEDVVRCWDVSGKLLRSIPRHVSWLLAHPSGRCLALPTFGGVELLDAATFEPVVRLLGHDGVRSGTSHFRMSPDGKFAVSMWPDEMLLVHDLARVLDTREDARLDSTAQSEA